MCLIKTENPSPYKLIDIQPVTPDTKSFRFELPEDSSVDLIPGDHLHLHLNHNGEQITRPYTPASTPDDIGFFELIVKLYPNGIASGYIHRQNIGNMVEFSGPHVGGHFEPGMAKHIGMIAGGAGITPMITIIRTAFRRNYDIDISLIFANKTEADIILHREFDEYARNRGNFRCLFALDQPPPNWAGHSGQIDDTVLSGNLPPPGADTLIFLCGPPMMEYAIRQKLLKSGYGKKQVVIP
jgi:cytochrome-b5 reductase